MGVAWESLHISSTEKNTLKLIDELRSIFQAIERLIFKRCVFILKDIVSLQIIVFNDYIRNSSFLFIYTSFVRIFIIDLEFFEQIPNNQKKKQIMIYYKNE